MLITLLTLILIIFINLILCLNPLTLGIWIFITALMLSIFINLLTPRWVPILLFLIYIGGIIVIFSYFIAIEPNQNLNIIKLIIILTISILYFLITIPNHLIIHTPFHSTLNSSFLLINHNIFILILLTILLFLALIVVVKISWTKKTPLRPFNYVIPLTKIPSPS